MPDQVALRFAQGDYYYQPDMSSEQPVADYQIVVENLNYVKDVAIWRLLDMGGWSALPAQYVESVGSGREIWNAHDWTLSRQFVVRYTVNGVTYWDNNGGADYRVPIGHGNDSLVLGSDVQVVREKAYFSDDTHLTISVDVKNMAYEKVVGVVYTTDNWTSPAQTAYGSYVGGGGSPACDPSTERWAVNITVPKGQTVQYAIFYRVLGREYWDNNFWRNYTAIPSFAAAEPKITQMPKPRPSPKKAATAGGGR